MKKWIPYVVAVLVAVVIAAVMFLSPTTAEPTPSADAPAAKATTTTTSTGSSKKQVKSVFKDDQGNPLMMDVPTGEAPPPGTLRPMSESELANQARRERPFNKHFARVGAFWNITARLVGPHDAEVSKEAQEMARYLRDQSRLSDEELAVSDVLQKELALEQKIRALGIQDDNLSKALDYINNSANSVIQGGDPAAVPKPDLDLGDK